jgi:hypothetical protein
MINELREHFTSKAEPHHVTVEMIILSDPDAFIKKLMLSMKNSDPIIEGAYVTQIFFNGMDSEKLVKRSKERILNEAIAELEKLKELI